MNKNTSKSVIKYTLPVFIFFILSLAYFIPDVLEGKKLIQHDIVQFKGMSKEIVDHRAKYGEEPLWTNSMFGGMPAYLVSTQYKSNILRKVNTIFTLWSFRPVCFVFLYLIGAYIALLLFGLSPWLSFAGAIAYAFSSYFFVIIQAGHVSKVFALGYMPPIIAGVYSAFRGKAMIGSLVAGVFLGLQMLVNHFQITYYTFLIILIFGLFELYQAIRNKTIREFLKPIPWLVLFVVLAVGANFSNFYTTYEYGKYSIRGKSDLTENAENKTSGLDKDYAMQWSYGIGETFTLLIPDFMGGSSSGTLKEGSNTYDLIKDRYGKAQAKDFTANVPLYWGKQPITSGPVYIGAVVIFLFVLGMFLLKGTVKWWLFVVTLFSIILAWGHNFLAFNNLMFEFFPGYNKFRTVTMTLIMAEFAMPLLGILTIREIFSGNISKQEFLKAFKYTWIGLGSLILVIMAISGSFDMSSSYDDQMRAQGLNEIVDAIQQDRLSMLRSDAFRSLIFISLTALLILFTFNQKLKTTTSIALLSFLLLADLWPVDKRYLNGKDFVSKQEDRNPFKASTADLIILKDKDLDYRVLNISLSPLQDASTSWFHKSIGGYHGAKMRRFQELYDHNIQNELAALAGTLQSKPTPDAIDSVMRTMNALNMLNTRYIIYNPDAPPLVNKSELGNSWFINEIKVAKDADEEISLLADLNPVNQGIVDQRFMSLLEGHKFIPDSSATIQLTEYRANYLKYTSNTKSDQVAVFSEVYYDKGWQALVDGKEVPHFRANYLLRAMLVPAGNHTIEFKFHPNSYFMGEKISFASSVVLILLTIGTFYLEWKKKNKTES